MSQYAGYYASGNNPSPYDYERQGPYDPYAAAAAGGAGAAAAANNNPYSDNSNNVSGNQYYLDPNEYDYDKGSRNDVSSSGYNGYDQGPFSDSHGAGSQQQHAPPPNNYVLSRQDSEGSVGEHVDDNYGNNRRGQLKVS